MYIRHTYLPTKYILSDTVTQFLFLGGKSDKDNVLKIFLGFRNVSSLHIFLGAVSRVTHFLACVVKVCLYEN